MTPQARDDRHNKAAAVTAMKRKAATSGDTASNPRRPKHQHVQPLTTEHAVARHAAAAAAGVAVAVHNVQVADAENTRRLAEAARQGADQAAARATQLEGQAAVELRAAAESRFEAEERRAILRIETEREKRELAAVIEEYIELKARMQRIRAMYEARTARKMNARTAPNLYKEAQARREELTARFPGRPWIKHPDYLRLERGDVTVGCAPVPTLPQ